MVPLPRPDADTPASLTGLLSNAAVSEQELSSAATHSYISHLTSLPLDTLLTEPSRLATESDILSSDLTQLCHSQHKTFLSLRSASNALSNSLGSLTSSLNSMLDEWIPSLEAEARMFSESTKGIQQSRAKASLVLEHHERLLDVLELPHLLATCIKNGYYSEALDLATHFEKDLVSTLPPSSLLESVHTSIVASLQTLLQQLLQQLRTPAKLPVLFKTVNLLRRMEVCSEEQLAMAFILGRSAHLDDAFSNANASGERDKEEDPARWLRRWVEVFREGVYDAITQYSSIFLASASPPSEPSSTSTALLRSILTNLTQNYLSQLLNHLKTTLKKIPLSDMSSFSSLLTQLSYCASSFARVGVDFRQALVPIVEDAILSIVGTAFTESADALVKSTTEATRAEKKAGEWLVEAESVNGLPRKTATSNTQAHIPPPHLAHFPPLAHYVNGVLAALNALRLLPAPSIFERVRAIQQTSLIRTSSSILGYVKSRQLQIPTSTEAGVEEARLLALVATAVWHETDGAIPYLTQALVRGVFSNHTASSQLSEDLRMESKRWMGWAQEAGIAIDLGRGEGVTLNGGSELPVRNGETRRSISEHVNGAVDTTS